MSMWTYIIIGGAVVAVPVLATIYYYNRFITLANRIKNSFAQIDVQLKRRSDLVPNLVEIVKGYMKHEKAVITEVTNARKAMLSAGTNSAKVKAGNEMAAAIHSILALAENYPKLEASANFKSLQEELASIENKVAYARQHYNDSVQEYNNTIERFPGKMFASIFGKKKEEWLEITSTERENVKIKF